jgi:hypothetical protein
MTRARRPNAVKYHDPRPAYIKSLYLAIQRPMSELATLTGVSEASLWRYVNPRSPIGQLAPYPVQYVLEALAWARLHDGDKRRLKAKSQKPDPLDSPGSGK